MRSVAIIIAVCLLALLQGCAATGDPSMMTGSIVPPQPGDILRRCSDLADERQSLASSITQNQAALASERKAPPDTLMHALERWSGVPGAGLQASEKITAAQDRSAIVTQRMIEQKCSGAEVKPVALAASNRAAKPVTPTINSK